MIDLKKQTLAVTEQLGDLGPEWFNVSADTIGKWQRGETSPGLAAAQRAVDYLEQNSPDVPGDLPSPNGETAVPPSSEVPGPHAYELIENSHPDAWEVDLATGRFFGMPGKKGFNLTMLLPVHRDISPAVVTCWMSLAKRYDVGFDIQGGSLLIQARNNLANRFLATRAEWALFLDSDLIFPIGNRDWYAGITSSQAATNRSGGYELIPRLLNHNRMIVGALYAQRQRNGKLVTQPDMAPKSMDDLRRSNTMRAYNGGGLTRVDWLASGCLLVNRSLFEKIKQREQIQGDYPFFTPRGLEGEDIAFSIKVKECGFDLWLDTDLVLGHIGKYCYLPENTNVAQAVSAGSLA
jgi:hypothetical protein